MTIELKTLKDIESCGSCIEYENCPDECIKQNLKYEAIKWIKEFSPKADKDGNIYNELGNLDKGNVTEWIKHFFNISEKELK